MRPFVWGITCVYPDGRREWTHFWEPDCTAKLVAWLNAQPGHMLIYAHNGGRFDFQFLLPHLAADVMVINGRIVAAQLGRHELRDSWAILPVRLAQLGEKEDFDYRHMRRVFRNRPPIRRRILHYLERDCDVLADAVLAYRERFGNKLTMAGAALHELELSVEGETGEPARMTLHRLRPSQDTDFRTFYFGGRVECFERGVIRGAFTVTDKNSMYPDVMAHVEHPTGRDFLRQESYDDRTDFAIVDATSRGAFPLRGKDGSLSFPHDRAVYRVTGHELRTAVELGLVDVHRLIWAAWCPVRATFATFVDAFYALRQAAADAGDEAAKLHYKLVLNSSYGRFCLNPDRIHEWCIVPNGEVPAPDDIDSATGERFYARAWGPAYRGEEVTFWRRSPDQATRDAAIRNVCTGASITGAARAVLLRAIAGATRPLYCDTDSLIAERVDVPLGHDLGQWKVEAAGTIAAVAQKKLYALFDETRGATDAEMKSGHYAFIDGRTVPAVKMASKGVRLTGHEILRAARGESVTWQAETPTINLAGVQSYMQRTVGGFL